MGKKTVAAKKRNVKVDANGQLHVHSSFNNIIVSLANSEGQIISWSSAGKMGFRGSKKNTPYAAQMAAQDCAKIAYDLGLRKVKAYVKMVSVSFDEYQSIFEETIRKDQIVTPTCFVETKGEYSGLFKKYRLGRGFTNYLLDDNGVIIAKNISAAELSAYLN